jgi:acetolactate synthase-1/2/3 large subunit
VAETLVAGLGELGIEVIFLNPGTDTAPVQEAVRALSAQGVQVPRVVLCMYEGVALAAAHAYYAATGRPQVVMVHVDVGTQNLGAMVHNAMRAEVGVVMIAGRTPATAYGELPGGRDATVHWHQDVPDQAGVVRPYVKWTGEVSAATPLRTVTRALQVAATSPAGPVYLTAEREVLMQPAIAEDVPPARYRAPIPPAPDAEAIARAARLLADAERPVVITTRVGQNPQGVAALVEVAERTGAVIVDHRERVNFPSSHPAYLTNAAQVGECLGQADVVLLADAPVPWIPAHGAPPQSATVIS